jgi:uncharacterized protein
VLTHLLLAGCGFVASVLNVIAGGGSFFTLPLLLLLGFPATEANGTNRLGVAVQSVGAVWGFQRHGLLRWRETMALAIPCMLGSGLGAWLALQVGDRDFRRMLSVFMVALTLWTLFDPTGRAAGALSARPWLLRAGFLLAGVYGGFLQAGVGFLVLVLTTLGGYDLVRGNAVKVVSILLQTALSLAIFAGSGNVHWREGASLAAGSLVGSLVGVHLTIVKGHRFVQTVVTVAIVVLAVHLWFS